MWNLSQGCSHCEIESSCAFQATELSKNGVLAKLATQRPLKLTKEIKFPKKNFFFQNFVKKTNVVKKTNMALVFFTRRIALKFDWKVRF